MKILVIRFSSLGDIILLSPVFREIKKEFASSKIVFMTAVEFQTIYQANPHITHTYGLQRKAGISEIFRARKFIQKENFDFIFDAHCSLRSKLICLFANSKIFYTFKRSWRRYLLIYFKKKSKKKIISQRASYLLMLQKFSNKKQIRDSSSEFFLCPQTKSTIANIFRGYLLCDTKLVVIAMGARYFNKCWPAFYWFSLVKKLKERKLQVVLIGTKQDKELVPNYSRVAKICSMDLTGKLSVCESAALLARALLLVCVDSAALHLAESVGTPVVAIFGPTSKEFGFAPFLAKSHLLEVELACKPCSPHGKKKCVNKKEKECMKLVSVESVWQSVTAILPKEQ